MFHPCNAGVLTERAILVNLEFSLFASDSGRQAAGVVFRGRVLGLGMDMLGPASDDRPEIVYL